MNKDFVELTGFLIIKALSNSNCILGFVYNNFISFSFLCNLFPSVVIQHMFI